MKILINAIIFLIILSIGYRFGTLQGKKEFEDEQYISLEMQKKIYEYCDKDNFDHPCIFTNKEKKVIY